MECFIIGRDLVRLLQNVARIPEMELLWRDLLHNPQTLSPQFTGVWEVWISTVMYPFWTEIMCTVQSVYVLLNWSVLSCPAGILQLLTSRTSRKFLACRLTPDMETKLLFMTSRVNTHKHWHLTLKPQYIYDLKGKRSCSPWLQVRFGQQKRYQDWFQRQYLSTAESQSLRCDLIRYICGVVHPSNEVLSSDILPRWAIIGWLLTTCTVGKY